MGRISVRKGTIVSSKILENLYGPKIVNPINFSNRYANKTLEEKILVATTEEISVKKLGAETKIMAEEVQITLEIVPWKIANNPVSEPLSTEREAYPTSKNSNLWEERMEREGRVDNPENNEANNEPKMFGFPILDITRNATMKNIPLSSLNHFNDISSKYPDSFLFKFDILCRSYNYIDNAQNLKLFLATLKNLALRWFMSLGEHTITSWDDMKETFLQKYQDYCGPRDAKNDIFKMQQTEEESLEDYLEKFLYNYQKNKQVSLDLPTIRTIFLKEYGMTIWKYLISLALAMFIKNHLLKLLNTTRSTLVVKLKLGESQENLQVKLENPLQVVKLE